MAIEIEHLPYVPMELAVEDQIDIPVAEAETPQPPHISILTSNHPEVGEQVRWASQSLHTDVYLEQGFIEEEDVNELGFYVDPYVNRSTYYFVKNGTKVASARQINCTKKEGILSLPTAKEFEIDPDAVVRAAEVRSLADLKPKEVVEISALASKSDPKGEAGDFDAVISLYSKMIRDSLEQGHKLWLLNTDPRFIRHLSLLVGEDQLHTIGKPKAYMGPPTIPAAINPQAVVRAILSSEDPKYDFHKSHVKELFKNIDARKLPEDMLDLFDGLGIDYHRPSKFAKHLTKEEVALQGIILAYSSARAFPAGGIDEFHGSIAALWGIDVATAVPYTHGMIKMYGAQRVRDKAVGAALAIPSFLAPYAYLYAEGQQYPGYVNAAVGAFVGVAVAKEIAARKLRSIRGARISRGLSMLPEASHIEE